MSDVLISAEGVSKKFCRSLKRSLWYGLQDLAKELTGREHGGDGRLRRDEFWAINDVSFELKRGECLGLIGRNGAGKTTLLRMLNGLIKPDKGRIEIRGRVGALIALGAGFNPILSGRENIYVNASVLGLSKREIDDRIEEIIDFAEIGEFIDAPVQNYSSGMQVRLGFAVATALKPDVLFLDEVLAVGDASFRAKCYNKIGQLLQSTAVVFVSHSMQQVAHICSTTLLLEMGRTRWQGDTRGGADLYANLNHETALESEAVVIVNSPVRRAELKVDSEKIGFAGKLNLTLDVELDEAMPLCSVRVPIYSTQGTVVAEWNSKSNGAVINLPVGDSILAIEVGPLHLAPGRYFIGFVVNDRTGVMLPFWSLRQHHFKIDGSGHGACDYQLPLGRITIAKTESDPALRLSLAK